MGVELSTHKIQNQSTHIIGGELSLGITTVVDYKDNPDIFEVAYDFYENIKDEDKSFLDTARSVGSVVMGMMPFSRVVMRRVLKQEAHARNLERLGVSDRVGLSRFVYEGGGVCHQQTLFAGTLFELIQKRDGLEGEVSFETHEDDADNPFDQHVWLRYTQGDQAFIIDPALQTYIELEKRSRAESKTLNAAISERYLRNDEIAQQ